MLKGAQKRMIVIRTSDSDLFEEAYFVVRAGVEKNGTDMVFEANKIIEGCAGNRKGKKRADSKALLLLALCFTVGMILGGGITLIAILPLL